MTMMMTMTMMMMMMMDGVAAEARSGHHNALWGSRMTTEFVVPAMSGTSAFQRACEVVPRAQTGQPQTPLCGWFGKA